MRMILPVGRSGYAIAAGYLGLFSVLLVPAPFALLFGFLAVMDIKKHKDKHGMGRAIFGIIMGVIFTIVLVSSGFTWFAELSTWGGE
jgi:heme/copper-type cytochrome/quinol oxidase subunit 3